LLVVGLIAVAVGLVISFSRASTSQKCNFRFGSFLVKTKHAEFVCAGWLSELARAFGRKSGGDREQPEIHPHGAVNWRAAILT